MTNSGQSCNAPTRMLVPSKRMDEVIQIAKAAAESVTVGDPKGNAPDGTRGIRSAVEQDPGPDQEGHRRGRHPSSPAARTGRTGSRRVISSSRQLFANVTNDMTIAKEEIFGPVVSILGYESVD